MYLQFWRVLLKILGTYALPHIFLCPIVFFQFLVLKVSVFWYLFRFVFLEMRNTSLLFLFSVYFWLCKGTRSSMEISFVLEAKLTSALLSITHCWGRGRVWTWARRGLEDWAHSLLLVFSPLASVPGSVRWSGKDEEDWVEGWCSLRWVWGRAEERGMWSCWLPMGKGCIMVAVGT